MAEDGESRSIVDRLQHHLGAAKRINSLSETFSLFAHDAIMAGRDEVDLRLLLWHGSLDAYPVNGLDNEQILRARLDQHRIARNVAKWARERLQVRETTRRVRQSWVTVEGPAPYAVNGTGLDAEGLGLVASSDLLFPDEVTDSAEVAEFGTNFERVWNDHRASVDATDRLLAKIDQLHRDNAPESIYLRILVALFAYFVDEAGEATVKRGKTGFYDTEVWRKLYKFQRDGVLGAIGKLEQHNGCILADSVGLGKTFEALAVIKYYELRNDRVLVLAPKRLRENWTLYGVGGVLLTLLRRCIQYPDRERIEERYEEFLAAV